ncbi:hypothetical protein Ait01nite_047620 [Actinoplanes italicus]|uniref:PknH-like protein n=1 Tax=Actinoplanes italicus TaxID=113567 RepID=A0A2T0K9Q7_9ACTN|nr:hypothetical protein [Actinoplanes italicus]PRX19865.1 hypothetical protein CLV67_109130 [Actinoplanes italicus]GIE31717.1 hypothetical protein Ait01nite_047620 [Actinoplanes italicus]
MRITHQKAIKFPAAFALSLGLGLGSAAGLPASASAAPGLPATAVTAPAEPPDRTEQLKKALLTEEDMPAGYALLDMNYFEPFLRSVLGEASVGGDPCAMSGSPAEVSSSPLAMPVQDVDLARSTGPVRTVDPVKTGPAEKDVPETPAAPPTALAIFENTDEGSMAMEVLSAGGEKEAGAALASLRTMLKECADIDVDDAELTLRALDWQQRLGDDSVAVEMVMQAKFAGIENTIRVKAVQVAYRDVSMTVGLMGAEDPSNKRLKKVARAAVRKLVTSTGIVTE